MTTAQAGNITESIIRRYLDRGHYFSDNTALALIKALVIEALVDASAERRTPESPPFFRDRRSVYCLDSTGDVLQVAHTDSETEAENLARMLNDIVGNWLQSGRPIQQSEPEMFTGVCPDRMTDYATPAPGRVASHGYVNRAMAEILYAVRPEAFSVPVAGAEHNMVIMDEAADPYENPYFAAIGVTAFPTVRPSDDEDPYL